MSDKENDEEVRDLQTIPISGTIAEREHKKWENPDIQLKDNPYSIENLNTRIQQRAQMLSLSEDSSPEVVVDENEKQNDSPFMSSKSKDMSRYRKDYYVKQIPKEETLRSFDENV